jgi:SnoaL-like domain
MSQENVEIVRRAADAFNRGGPEAAFAWLAPNVEWHDLPDLPDAEIHRRQAGFLKAFEQFFGGLKLYASTSMRSSIAARRWLSAGETLVKARQRSKVRATNIWRLDRTKSTLVRAVWFRTREEALEAVGLED